MQVIETKFHGPTDTKGARVSASSYGFGSVTLPWDHALTSEGNHKAAAKAFMDKCEWFGRYICGHNKRGMTFVFDGGEFAASVERW